MPQSLVRVQYHYGTNLSAERKEVEGRDCHEPSPTLQAEAAGAHGTQGLGEVRGGYLRGQEAEHRGVQLRERHSELRRGEPGS